MLFVQICGVHLEKKIIAITWFEQNYSKPYWCLRHGCNSIDMHFKFHKPI